MMQTLVLFGAPGSGKGTQCNLLTQRLSFFHISTGNLLRAEIADQTPLGKKVKEVMDRGDLVSDDLVSELLESNLKKTQNKPLIFDGYPRNVTQAGILSDLMKKVGRSIDAAIFIDVPEDQLFKRLTGRRTCEKCGTIYNLYFTPPAQPGACDKCGSRSFIHRPDDEEKVIQSRLQVYKTSSLPLIDYFKSKKIYFELDGQLETEVVYKALEKILKQP